MDFIVRFSLCGGSVEESRQQQSAGRLPISQTELEVTQTSYTFIIAEVHFSQLPAGSSGFDKHHRAIRPACGSILYYPMNGLAR